MLVHCVCAADLNLHNRFFFLCYALLWILATPYKLNKAVFPLAFCCFHLPNLRTVPYMHVLSFVCSIWKTNSRIHTFSNAYAVPLKFFLFIVYFFLLARVLSSSFSLALFLSYSLFLPKINRTQFSFSSWMGSGPNQNCITTKLVSDSFSHRFCTGFAFATILWCLKKINCFQYSTMRFWSLFELDFVLASRDGEGGGERKNQHYAFLRCWRRRWCCCYYFTSIQRWPLSIR